MSEIEVKKDHYLIDGKKYVRVTRILDVIAKPEFYRWYGKHGYKKCQQIMTTRAGFGTRVHKEIYNYLSGEDIWIDNEEMKQTMEIFTEWAEEHKLDPLLLEHHIKNEEYMYAGTSDFIGFCDGKKLLLDWKTSKAIYDNFYLQLAAYFYAYERESGVELDGAGILGIRDGKVLFDKIDREKCLELFDVFKAARRIYKWKYGV